MGFRGLTEYREFAGGRRVLLQKGFIALRSSTYCDWDLGFRAERLGAS